MTNNDLVTTGQQQELVHAELGNRYQQALVTWLNGKRENTRRSYKRIVVDFSDWVGNPSSNAPFGEVTPDQVTPDMVTAWKLHLQSLGRKDATIAQRLAGLSSYFTHCVRHGLLYRNPCDLVDTGDLELSPYGNARPMTMTNFRAIMAELDPDTPAGALHRAMFVAYVLTGRRRSELLNLKGRDIEVDGDRLHYRVTLKGGKRQRLTMPRLAWAEIQNYLYQTGRELGDDDYLFVATQPTGSYVDDQGNYIERQAGESRISDSAVQEALKRAAERAGINPDQVTLHGLRHLSAQLHMMAHDGDVFGLRKHLGHSSLAVTDVYLMSTSSDDSTNYDAMASILMGK